MCGRSSVWRLLSWFCCSFDWKQIVVLWTVVNLWGLHLCGSIVYLAKRKPSSCAAELWSMRQFLSAFSSAVLPFAVVIKEHGLLRDAASWIPNTVFWHISVPTYDVQFIPCYSPVTSTLVNRRFIRDLSAIVEALILIWTVLVAIHEILDWATTSNVRHIVSSRATLSMKKVLWRLSTLILTF